MVYVDGKWRIIDKNELVEDIYENKRDFIIQNLDNFINKLDEHKKKSLKRWLNTDDDDISIKNTKNDIKMLLFNNRHMAMDQKKAMEREKRKLEIISMPKKIKSKPNTTVKVVEVESENNSESESDIEINKKSISSSDSSESENYSYLHSDSSESTNTSNDNDNDCDIKNI